MQSANQTERKIPKPLEAKREIGMLTEEDHTTLGIWTKELEALANENSKFFMLQPGEEKTVIFDIKDENNLMIEKTFIDKKTGKPNTKHCRQFVLELEDGNKKLWAPSPTWGMKAIAAIDHWGVNILIKRKGAGLDTEYEFWDTPVPAFKMGG